MIRDTLRLGRALHVTRESAMSTGCPLASRRAMAGTWATRYAAAPRAARLAMRLYGVRSKTWDHAHTVVFGHLVDSLGKGMTRT